jgi:eukaryotic-like serine/threonine-protein kinase
MGRHVVDPVRVAGRYRLLEPVGSGGMGRVWLARDEMLHRDVAIKEVVPPTWLTQSERDELRQRTLREARAAAQLNHPNVVKIFDVVHTEAWPWIVMEYVASRSLQQVINEEGPLSPRRAAAIGLAVLAALRAAHRAGVLHRDVKPHNVLIGSDGRVVLTDFGLATFEDDGAITRAGLVMGSPQYVAPERAAKAISTVETDLWSLGATLFAAVEGHSPFARPTTMATLTALATEPPDQASHAGPLALVLDGLLRKDPRERMTAMNVERQLRLVKDGGGPTTGPLAPAGSPSGLARRLGIGRRNGRARWVAAGTAMALALALLVASLLSQPRPPSDRGAGGGGPASNGPSATGSPTRVALVSGVRACDSPGAGAGVLTPLAGATASVDGFELPAGWSWHHDPTGFWLAVPNRWRYFRVGTSVCFVDPGGSRRLGVDTDLPATNNPVSDMRRLESRLRDSGRLPGYTHIRIEPTLFAAGAEWEFTYEDGGQWHAQVRSYPPTAGRALALVWVTSQFDWSRTTDMYNLVTTSLRPTDK